MDFLLSPIAQLKMYSSFTSMRVQKQAPEFTEGMGWGRCWDLSPCVPSGAAVAITRVAEVVVIWCRRSSVG